MKNTRSVDSVSLHLALNLAMVGAAMPKPDHDGDSSRTLYEVMVSLSDSDVDTALELALQLIERRGLTTADKDPGIFVLAGIVALLNSCE